MYGKSGISLGEGKEALVSARVGRRMRVLGIQEHRAYLDQVMQDAAGEEMVHLLDAISTNVTSFFRERDHFDFISRAMDEWLAAGQKQFRFWSAACSTGEEPYSLAMTLLDAAQGRSIDLKILATDISTRVLEKAQEGVYESDRIEGVPPALRDRYFERHHEGRNAVYLVKSAVRNIITFKRLNLSTPPFPMHGPFDAVFCRNVMIYFDNRVRKGLLADMYRLLRNGGYLMVGHAESLTGMVSDFKVVRPSVYTR
jgi:chemotaxis protein methyltransferase CheR